MIASAELVLSSQEALIFFRNGEISVKERLLGERN